MTEEVAAELGHEIGVDGFFYMTVEQLIEQAEYIGLNYNTEFWRHSYYLSLDDDGVGSVPGEWEWCGPTCTRYMVYVKNTSDQNNIIHVGAHTWRWRSYP